MFKLTAVLYFLLLLMACNVSANNELQTISDLRVLKQQTNASNLPVLIMFTAEDCDYCDAIRDNYLLPMIKSGDYSSSLLFRQLYIEDFNYIHNEKGELVGGDSIAFKYNVDVTPTLLFIDANWRELTERIVGIGTPDYFDELLNTHITQAVLSHARANFSKSKN